MNRIKSLRNERNWTIKDLETKLKEIGISISSSSLIKYERGEREPKIDKYNALAEVFNVPTSYLMGVSDDINGWEEWAKNTGYSVKQIKNEIKRLIETKRLDSSTDVQHQIDQAVKSLDSASYSTTQGVQHELVFQLTNLISKVDGAFLEPQQLNSKNKSVLNMVNYKPEVRTDMDPEAYKKIINALTEAKYKIGQIPIDKKYL